MKINYKYISIDSFCVLTPLDAFSQIDEQFFDEICEVNMDTAEILNKIQKPIYHEKDGITIRAFITNFFGKRYLSCTYSSKIMQRDYLYGLSFESFFAAFEYVREIFKFEISYSDYLEKSIVNDVDFKQDFYATDKEFHDICNFYASFPSAKVYYTSKQNFLDERCISGMQFVNRRDASVRSPFVKFYSKEAEMYQRSLEFLKTFFHDDSIFNNLRRLETTVKNKQHFESFKHIVHSAAAKGLQINSLKHILMLTDAQIQEIIWQQLGRYTSIRPNEIEREPAVKVAYSPTDYLIMQSFYILMQENNFTLNQCLSLVDSYHGLNDNTKSRIKTRIKKAFKEYIRLRGLRELKISPTDAWYNKE